MPACYVGGGSALGKGLYEPGFRLRAVASFGRYHYDGTLPDGGDYVPTTFDGEDAFLSALVGYQFRKGAVSSPSCSPASRPRTSISPRTIPTIRCRAASSDLRLQARPGSTLERLLSLG